MTSHCCCCCCCRCRFRCPNHHLHQLLMLRNLEIDTLVSYNSSQSHYRTQQRVRSTSLVSQLWQSPHVLIYKKNISIIRVLPSSVWLCDHFSLHIVANTIQIAENVVKLTTNSQQRCVQHGKVRVDGKKIFFSNKNIYSVT